MPTFRRKERLWSFLTGKADKASRFQAAVEPISPTFSIDIHLLLELRVILVIQWRWTGCLCVLTLAYWLLDVGRFIIHIQNRELDNRRLILLFDLFLILFGLPHVSDFRIESCMMVYCLTHTIFIYL